jgi:hypothetical protein
MLVSVITRPTLRHNLRASSVINTNLIDPLTIANPPIDGMLLPAGVLNAHAFGVPVVSKQPALALTPAGFVNTNLFHPKTISIDSGAGVYQTPSYANAGGTGDRTSIITVTTDATLGGSSGPASTLVNGLKANGAANACWVVTGQSNRRFRFSFGHRVLITEAKWFQNGPSAQGGTWKWLGTDDGVAMTDLCSSFTLDGQATGLVIGNLSANTTGFKFYDLQQTGGNTSDSPWFWECEFKIGNPV